MYRWLLILILVLTSCAKNVVEIPYSQPADTVFVGRSAPVRDTVITEPHDDGYIRLTPKVNDWE